MRTKYNKNEIYFECKSKCAFIHLYLFIYFARTNAPHWTFICTMGVRTGKTEKTEKNERRKLSCMKIEWNKYATIVKKFILLQYNNNDGNNNGANDNKQQQIDNLFENLYEVFRLVLLQIHTHTHSKAFTPTSRHRYNNQKKKKKPKSVERRTKLKCEWKTRHRQTMSTNNNHSKIKTKSHTLMTWYCDVLSLLFRCRQFREFIVCFI